MCQTAHRQTDTKVNPEDTLSGFQDFSFNLSSRIGPILGWNETLVNIVCCHILPAGHWQRVQPGWPDILRLCETTTSYRSPSRETKKPAQRRVVSGLQGRTVQGGMVILVMMLRLLNCNGSANDCPCMVVNCIGSANDCPCMVVIRNGNANDCPCMVVNCNGSANDCPCMVVNFNGSANDCL